VKKAAPFIAKSVVFFIKIWPYLMKALIQVQLVFERVPSEVTSGVTGFFMCFFGGVFPATIAAGEAWRLCGGVEAIRSLQVIGKELQQFAIESEKDDQKDEDHDGIADVDEINSTQLFERKALLAMKCCDPVAVNKALSLLFTGWIGVLANLKVQFARTVTLGASIGEMLTKVSLVFAAPIVEPFVPREHRKWVPIIIQWICKAIGVSLAWWVQRIQSGFHSAIRGGKMFGESLVNTLHKRGLLQSSPEETYIDEIVGWILAAIGFLWQLKYGFALPFVFRLFLFPLEIVEWYIVWEVMT